MDEKAKKLAELIEEAETIVIGAGSGLSTSAGLVFTGERFRKHFSEWEKRYGFHDMYSGWFHPYGTSEERWAYWAKYAVINRYGISGLPLYKSLLNIVKDKDYFVLTTNTDHQFVLSGFDKQRLFYTQGDFDLLQCSVPCHEKTYESEDRFKNMVAKTEDLRIPKELVPRCPVCGEEMTCNMRIDDRFVEDTGWHEACERYQEFIRSHSSGKVLYLELGVGFNSPGVVKYPFWRMVGDNPEAMYAVIAKEDAVCSDGIKDRSLCINADIAEVIEKVYQELCDKPGGDGHGYNN